MWARWARRFYSGRGWPWFEGLPADGANSNNTEELGNSRRRRTVLVPGAGAGRLAYEIALLGFDVDVNDGRSA